MKAKHTTLLIAVALMSASCAQMEVTMAENTSVDQIQSTVGMLRFSDESELVQAIESGSVLRTKTESGQFFRSLMSPVKDCDMESDPMLRVMALGAGITVDAIAAFSATKTLYDCLGYGVLIPNEDFASLLNSHAEFKVGSTVYHISCKGTFYFAEDKLEYFESNYSSIVNRSGNLIGENLYEIESGIYRYDTFYYLTDEEIISRAQAEDLTLTKSVSDELPEFSWANYPTHQGSASDVFDNQIFYFNMSSNRRLKTRVYYHNYIAYRERGAYAKIQKKVTIGWSDLTADVLSLSFSNIIMQGAYTGPSIPPIPSGQTYFETEDVVFEGVSTKLATITGYNIPSSLFNSIASGTGDTVRNIIRNATGRNTQGCSIIRLVTPSTEQTIFVGNWNFGAIHEDEVKVPFTSIWLASSPSFVAGQFRYAGIDESGAAGHFGAMRVGTAF